MTRKQILAAIATVLFTAATLALSGTVVHASPTGLIASGLTFFAVAHL